VGGAGPSSAAGLAAGGGLGLAALARVGDDGEGLRDEPLVPEEPEVPVLPPLDLRRGASCGSSKSGSTAVWGAGARVLGRSVIDHVMFTGAHLERDEDFPIILERC
jgi:hypothetical protein